MSDRAASSFALGYLAAGSAVELAGDVAAVVARGGQASTVVNTADLRALSAQNREFHALLAEVQYLRELNKALVLDVAGLEKYSDELRIWGQSLQDRLNAVSR